MNQSEKIQPESDPGVRRVPAGRGGSSLNADGTYTRSLAYPEPVPAGLLTILVNGNELMQLTGPWQATWMKPVEVDSTPAP